MDVAMLTTSLAILSVLALATLAMAATPEAGMDLLKQRYVDEAMQRPADAERVDHLVATLGDDGRWPGIDYEDLSRTGFEHRRHLANLRQLARARAGGNDDASLHAATVAALEHWLEQDYLCENWWHNEIGTPRQLAGILLLLDDELTDAQRDAGVAIVARANLDGFGARPGGDLVQIAEIMVQRGLIANDVEVIRQAVAAMVDELRITTDRGIQPDHSFHHRTDGVIQTTAYGQGYSRAVAAFAAKAQDTPFALPDAAIELVIDHQLEGIRWTLAHGTYPPLTSINRGISRRSSMRARDPETLQELLAISNHRADELRTLVRARQGERPVAWRGHRYYWRSTFAAHQRPAWHASVRMYSQRNHSTEGTYNQEGLRNHHLADGSHAIVRSGEEYLAVPPVWDWQKIPGTTVMQKPTLPGPDDVQQRGLTSFVGGVSDGTYGLAAMDFQSPHDPLAARKAWFFFDDEFVMLGTSIETQGEHRVATTLNQTRLDGPVTLGRDDAAGQRVAPGEHELEDVTWVHHDGVAYVLTAPATVNLHNTTARGTWRAINQQRWASDDPVELEMFTLWLDHGVRPGGADYACVIVPDVDADAVPRYAASPPVRVVANTAALQAVWHERAGQGQVAFYEPGDVELAGGVRVAVDQPCLVLVAVRDGHVQRVTVADPTQELRQVQVRITGASEHELRFDLPSGGDAGSSVTRPVTPDAVID